MSIKQNGGVFGRNPTFNDVTIEGDLIINGEVFTGLDFQGSWNASTNSPTLASSVGTNGEFYIVSIAGTTNLNGITNWGIGDWAIFNGTAWQRVEGGADGNFNDVTVAGTLGVAGEITATGIDVTGNVESDSVTIGVGAVAGTEKLRVNGTILTLSGTTAAPAVGIGDVNTGIYAPTVGTLGWTVNGAQRLLLDSTGIDVTGTATMDGLSVIGASTGGTYITSASGSAAGDIKIQHIIDSGRSVNTLNSESGAGAAIRLDFATGDVARQTIASNGDISFYEDTGTTPKLFWDASAESLGIGTSSPTSPLTVNRLSTDGTIASFEKDGTTVGSIGAGNTRLYAGSYDTGISFAYDVDTIRPYNTTTGADRDNAINLGSSAARFKDLYLSGGVVFNVAGGTGTSTSGTLDDYEEGTWTPAFTFGTSGSVTYTTQLGTYRKVGSLVFVSIALNIASVSSPTGAVTINNLPFTSGSDSNFCAMTIGQVRSLVTARPDLAIYGGPSNAILSFSTQASNAGFSQFQGSDLKAGTVLFISGSYISA
jgi:hypothetical protein